MNGNAVAQQAYAIGLILYYPEESLIKRVNLMVEHGFKVYIFDNSPFETRYNYIFEGSQEVTYLTAGKNVGIGFSLSTICATAFAHGYRQLLFLDQDTGISNRTLNFINNFSKSLAINVLNQYAALVFNGSPSEELAVKDVRLAINSGSLYNLPVLEKIGWINENYFVDCVDYEFCVRARRSGFKIGLIKNAPDFDHITEQPDRAINIFGKQVLIRRYNLSRISDALDAYAKIIFGGLLKNSIGDTVALIKSASIYVVNQVIARLIPEKK